MDEEGYIFFYLPVSQKLIINEWAKGRTYFLFLFTSIAKVNAKKKCEYFV
jgi:hypothetical protein